MTTFITSPAPTLEVTLDTVLAGGITPVFQPIVHLDTGEAIAVESLARGPRGSALESPGALFSTAGAAGRLAELDRACRVAALIAAIGGGLRRPLALFVNIEPESIEAQLDPGTGSALAEARRHFDVFFEVTERALTHRPAELLELVERLRADGVGIALDDVGADRRSLALLPLLRPDVVKLDMSLIHGHPSHRSGEVMNGVCAYAEQTGAAILAEGIETERHVLAARSMGATLAQGWHFGRPGPLDATTPTGRAPVRLGLAARRITSSPWELLADRPDVRIGRKDVLLSVTRALEAQAAELGEHAVVASAFQHVRHFTPRTRERYERLGSRAALTVALGVGMEPAPAPGVRGASLPGDDALVDEWDIAVLGPHFAGALVARDLGDTGPDRERRFEFVVTFERPAVVEIAACLIGRVGDA